MSTYLYHKRHKITGLNYFGKTTSNPYTYTGSGLYWKNHLKVHGNAIETMQVWAFENLDECSKFAIKFSEDNNIVESDNWANLKIENGLDGGNNPHAHTFEARKKREATIAARKLSGNPLPNNNTEETIAKAKITRASTTAKRKVLGIPHRGPDKKPRRAYIMKKPFVNRNTPDSIAKRKETLANKKLNQSSHHETE